MDHLTASQLLGEFAAGELTEAETEAVRAHCDSCRDCREVVALIRELLSDHTLRNDLAGGEGHPTADELAMYILQPDLMESAKREAVEKHLAACPECHADVQAVTPAHEPEAAALNDQQRTHRAWIVWAPIAAALALLVVPAYVGVFRYPALQREIEQLKQQSAGKYPSAVRKQVSNLPGEDRERPPGPAAVLVLLAPRRSAAEGPVYRIREGQRFIPVQAELDLSPSRSGGDPQLTTSIRDARTGAVLWQARQPASALWDESGRCASLLVPVAGLPYGALKFEVLNGEAVLFRSGIRLSRQ